MTGPSLAERVAALERELAALKAAFRDGTRPRDWRRTVGMFSNDDELMKRIDAAGQAIREKERRRARRGAAPRQRAKT